jgi:hypothetical protein
MPRRNRRYSRCEGHARHHGRCSTRQIDSSSLAATACLAAADAAIMMMTPLRLKLDFQGTSDPPTRRSTLGLRDLFVALRRHTAIIPIADRKPRDDRGDPDLEVLHQWGAIRKTIRTIAFERTAKRRIHDARWRRQASRPTWVGRGPRNSGGPNSVQGQGSRAR